MYLCLFLHSLVDVQVKQNATLQIVDSASAPLELKRTALKIARMDDEINRVKKENLSFERTVCPPFLEFCGVPFLVTWTGPFLVLPLFSLCGDSLGPGDLLVVNCSCVLLFCVAEFLDANVP